MTEPDITVSVTDYAAGVAAHATLMRESNRIVVARWLTALEEAWPDSEFTQGARDAYEQAADHDPGPHSFDPGDGWCHRHRAYCDMTGRSA